MQFSATNQIVDLQVKGDWILVVFENSFKLFNFEIGFKQDQVVAEQMTQTNTAKTGRVAIYQNADESSISIAYADHEKKAKVNIYNYETKTQIVKDTSIYVTDGKTDFGCFAFS